MLIRLRDGRVGGCLMSAPSGWVSRKVGVLGKVANEVSKCGRVGECVGVGLWMGGWV